MFRQHDEVNRWRYRCPECEMSDAELGNLATDDEVECIVCLVEQGRTVRLIRWVAEEAAACESPARVLRRAAGQASGAAA